MFAQIAPWGAALATESSFLQVAQSSTDLQVLYYAGLRVFLYHLVLLVFAVFRIFAVLTLSVLCVEYGFISVVDPSSVAHEQRVGFQPATTFIFYATTTQIYNIAYVLTYDRLNCLTNYVGYLYTSFLVQSTVLSSCYLHVHFQDATN